jgi:hypothetical protein
MSGFASGNHIHVKGKKVMNKLGKVTVIVGALAVLIILFIVPTMLVVKSFKIWNAYWGYVETMSDLTGLNRYLVTAGALLMFVPFFIGADMLFSVRSFRSRRTRYTGAGILLVLAAGYNVSLYYVTKDVSFAFVGGAPQKWYALTPEGVKFYDRPGVDPNYGIPLKPVTPEVVRKLRLLEKGEFKPIDPARATFFNPITGEPQVWYYKYPDGTLEFYDKPGFHPVTGTPLQPVTQQIYFEWKKSRQGTVDHPRVGPNGGVEVRSDPRGAETYLNWKPKGQTPLPLAKEETSGLLVVAKEGYKAGFRRIDVSEKGPIEFTLPPEPRRVRTRLLLMGLGGASLEFLFSLRSQLVERGFTVLGIEEAKEFQREMEIAGGGLSHRGFRAWARARFDTDIVVIARFRKSSRDLSEQELRYLGIERAVKGAVRTEVSVDLEAIDLRTGDHLAAVSGKGSSTALGRNEGFHKALTQAATESAKLLRERIQG